MNARASSFFFFAILLAVIFVAALLFFPFFKPLILAAAAAVLVFPVYRELQRVLGDGKVKNNISSFVTVILFLVVILVPLFFLAGNIYSEVQSLYSALTDEANRSTLINTLNNLSVTFSQMILGVLPAKSFDSLNVTEYLKTILVWVFGNLDNIFSGFAKLAGYLLVFLLALFYFLRDGVAFKNKLLSWNPLLTSNSAYITETFKKAVRSVFAGTMAVSIIEGVSTGLAFLVFGIPAPALWGTVVAIAALVPGFGVSLIILPAAAYLIFSGNILYAVGLLVWGYTVVFFVDHILGPNMINKGLKVHPFLVLLSVLGGLLVFGISGFILGPLTLVLLFTLFEIYTKQIAIDAPNR